jgi:hypothetical protein
MYHRITTRNAKQDLATHSRKFNTPTIVFLSLYLDHSKERLRAHAQGLGLQVVYPLKKEYAKRKEANRTSVYFYPSCRTQHQKSATSFPFSDVFPPATTRHASKQSVYCPFIMHRFRQPKAGGKMKTIYYLPSQPFFPHSD